VRSQARLAALLLLPAAIAVFGVVLYPAARALIISFYDVDSPFAGQYPFVGLRNYTEALVRDQRFIASIWNTAVLIAPSLAGELLLGLGIALLLNRVVRGRPIITALLAIPAMVSPVMAAMAWRMMFGVKYGAINNLGRQLGLLDVYFDWFGSPVMSIIAVVLVEVWHNTPFMMLVLLAGIQSIPQELYEAARTDGAGPWTIFRRITLPLISPTILLTSIITVVGSLQVFAQIAVLTQGGPGTSTTVLVYYLYQQAFQFKEFGYASAVSVALFVLVAVLTFVQWQTRKRWVHHEV
jgi:ABC-type sugar transport system permease subunit